MGAIKTSDRTANGSVVVARPLHHTLATGWPWPVASVVLAIVGSVAHGAIVSAHDGHGADESNHDAASGLIDVSWLTAMQPMQLLLPLLLVVAGLTFVYFGWRVYRFLTHVLGDASPRPSAAPGPPPRRQRSVREASRE